MVVYSILCTYGCAIVSETVSMEEHVHWLQCFSVAVTAVINILVHISLYFYISISLRWIPRSECLGQKIYTFKFLLLKIFKN